MAAKKLLLIVLGLVALGAVVAAAQFLLWADKLS